MRKFSYSNKLETPRSLGENFSYWIRSLFEITMMFAGVSVIVRAVFEVSTWAIELLLRGAWLPFIGVVAIFLLAGAWLAIRSITERLWFFFSCPLSSHLPHLLFTAAFYDALLMSAKVPKVSATILFALHAVDLIAGATRHLIYREAHKTHHACYN